MLLFILQLCLLHICVLSQVQTFSLSWSNLPMHFLLYTLLHPPQYITSQSSLSVLVFTFVNAWVSESLNLNDYLPIQNNHFDWNSAKIKMFEQDLYNMEEKGASSHVSVSNRQRITPMFKLIDCGLIWNKSMVPTPAWTAWPLCTISHFSYAVKCLL